MTIQALERRPQAVPSTVLDQDTVSKLVLNGDMKGLSPAQQIAYYQYRCEALDLDPRTQPFDIINLQGKLTLYAKKECASQLSSKRGLSAIIISQGVQGDLYVVQARCKGPDGRETDDLGAVSIINKKGDELCNAMMKAATKAKRRAILTHCGLGMLDESELETVKGKWGDSGSKEAAKASAERTLEGLRANEATTATVDAASGYAVPLDACPACGEVHGQTDPCNDFPDDVTPREATSAPTTQPRPSSEAPSPSQRPAADPRAGKYLYSGQDEDIAVFGKLKYLVGRDAYYRCLETILGFTGAKSLHIKSRTQAHSVHAALKDTAAAQKAQRKLEAEKLMDESTVEAWAPLVGLSIPDLRKKVQMHKDAGEDWETLIVRLKDLQIQYDKSRGKK